MQRKCCTKLYFVLKLPIDNMFLSYNLAPITEFQAFCLVLQKYIEQS